MSQRKICSVLCTCVLFVFALFLLQQDLAYKQSQGVWPMVEGVAEEPLAIGSVHT